MARTIGIVGIALVFALSWLGDTTSAKVKVKKKIRFEPIDTVERLQTDFPYETEFRFKKLPTVGDSAVLHVKLKAKRDLADTVRFTVRALPTQYVEMGTDEIVWPTPSKNKSFEIEIPVRFDMGGNYTLLFEQHVRLEKRYGIYTIAISFGLDGEAIYFGEHPTPVSNCPGYFYTYNMDAVRVIRKNQFEGYRRRMGIPFDLDLRISPVPRVNQTSRARFRVVTNSNFIHDIQFQWNYSPNMTLDSMPRSWGGRPRAGHTYYGSFDFTPRFPGTAVIEFKVFGKDIYSRLTGKREMEIPLTMIFDSTGTLLHFGEVNIFDCSFPEDDPLTEQLSSALDFAQELPRLTIVRSQPDYEAVEKKKAAESDSTTVDPSVVDSIMKSLRDQKNQ
jgi:hypothetical protein